MVKQRMSSADVAGEVACLRQRILGLRLANVYDLNAKVGTCKGCEEHATPASEHALSPTLACHSTVSKQGISAHQLARHYLHPYQT